MEYCFCFGPVNRKKVLTQAAVCLEKQREILSEGQSGNGFGERFRRRPRWVSLVLLIAGALLLIPILKHPEELDRLWLPFLGGLAGISFGISGLLPKYRKFLIEAEKMLQNLESAQGTRVRFTEEGMELPLRTVAYEAMDAVLETEDLFFVISEGRAVLLKKQDLENASPDAFREFLEGKKPVMPV